ncbi:hypothetical protein ACRXCV_00535 (plasmid) [Halobacteriovorax sp. GFR7]|uniref:hypothetical protein n=1 Tax=unclassified Halobacteriovorax TaxID=2639665 RepID=UPI003D986459
MLNKLSQLKELLVEIFYHVCDGMSDTHDELCGHGFKTFKAWVRVLFKGRFSVTKTCALAFHEAYTLRGYKKAFEVKCILNKDEYEQEYLDRVATVQSLVRKSLTDGGLPLSTPEQILELHGDKHITPYTPLMWYVPDFNDLEKLNALYKYLEGAEKTLKQAFFDAFGKMTVARNASCTFDIIPCAQSACSVVVLGSSPVCVIPWERLETMGQDLLNNVVLNYTLANRHFKNVKESIEKKTGQGLCLK